MDNKYVHEDGDPDMPKFSGVFGFFCHFVQ